MTILQISNSQAIELRADELTFFNCSVSSLPELICIHASNFMANHWTIVQSEASIR
jgi:hypothetical protein